MLESGINRRINREKFNLDELETELEDSEALRYKVYNQMVSLLGLRQQLSAFSPQSSQKVLELGEGIFALIRGEGEEAIRFIVNITSSPQDIYLDDGGVDVITNASFSNTFTLKPYQFVWLMQQ